MSTSAIIVIFVLLILIISQFGHRLAARNSIVWWIIGAFLAIALVKPSLYLPLVQLMGIQIVSNFVLASLVMFLFIQVLELTVETTSQSRKTRQLVSNLASDKFCDKNSTLLSADPRTVRILVVLPSYNEEEALPTTIADIKALRNSPESEGLDIQICFVDDGSRDRSVVILESELPRNYVSHSCNIGVAGVLMTGFAIAKRIHAQYVVQCDSDGQHPIEDIPKFVREAIRVQADLLVGSRFSTSTGSLSHESTTMARITGIQLIRSMLKLFGKSASIKDPTSGFRVYSSNAQKILSGSMPDEYPEPESIALLASKGAHINEFAVSMLPRSTGVSSINGLKSLRFMVKVITALIGLRMRTLISANARATR